MPNSKLLIISFLSLFIISLPLVFVQGDDYGDEFEDPSGTEGDWGGPLGIENPLDAENFTELINNIAAWIFNIAIALATVMFLIGGFQFLVSGGNDEKVTKAKKTMLWAAVGLGVCLIGAGFTKLIEQLLGTV